MPEAKLYGGVLPLKIRGLYGDAETAEWVETKRTVPVLGVKKGLGIRPFYRSADFIAPACCNDSLEIFHPYSCRKCTVLVRTRG